MIGALKSYMAQNGLRTPQTIYDMGCSVGQSSRWLRRELPEADITGLDLSTYMLAVAELEERYWALGTPHTAA